MSEQDGAEPRGVRLGLPAAGPGSVAGMGRRLGAYLVDSVVSALVAAVFISDPVDGRRGLLTLGVFVLQYLLLGSLTGSTVGMRLLGLRMLHLPDPDRPPGLVPMAKRTALLVLLVPAVVYDRDNRGLHDLFARTAVVRTG
ncbi:MAG TPA: RDD family protein [Mycobacteriales bacterium]|nr:RDD family protein [Mycobacteriales bacterium]